MDELAPTQQREASWEILAALLFGHRLQSIKTSGNVCFTQQHNTGGRSPMNTATELDLTRLTLMTV